MQNKAGKQYKRNSLWRKWSMNMCAFCKGEMTFLRPPLLYTVRNVFLASESAADGSRSRSSLCTGQCVRHSRKHKDLTQRQENLRTPPHGSGNRYCSLARRDCRCCGIADERKGAMESVAESIDRWRRATVGKRFQSSVCKQCNCRAHPFIGKY